MEAIIELLHSNGMRSFSWALIHSLWQGLAIVFIVSILLKMIRRDNAQMKYFILINATIFFLLSVFITFTIVHQKANNESASLEIITQNESQIAAQTNSLQIIKYINETSNPYLFPFILFWLIGVFILFLRFLFGILELNKLKKDSLNINDSKIIEHFDTLMKRFRISEKIKLYSSETINSPLTFGFFKPIIILPISLLSDLSIEQIELIITHELLHIKRRDYFVNLIQSFIEILFFFNPAIWWLSKNIRKERENCCDDGVLEHFDPLKYSQTLIQVESNRIKLQQQQLYLSVSNNQNLLLTRIKRIMKPNSNQNQSTLVSKLIVSFLLFSCILMISWMIPRDEKVIRKNADLPVKTISSSFKSLINSSPFFDIDTPHAIINNPKEKIIAETIAQLKLAEEKPQLIDKKELKEAMDLLSERKVIIAQFEKKVQHALETVMVDSANTTKQEIALVKDLKALEESEMLIKEMEHSIEQLQFSIEYLEDSTLNAVAEQNKKIKEQSEKVAQQSKRIEEQSEKIAQQSKRVKEQAEKVAKQSSELKEKLELIEDELIKREIINDRSKYSFKINKTDLYINDEKQPQDLFHFFNSLLGGEEYQIRKVGE